MIKSAIALLFTTALLTGCDDYSSNGRYEIRETEYGLILLDTREGKVWRRAYFETGDKEQPKIWLWEPDSPFATEEQFHEAVQRISQIKRDNDLAASVKNTNPKPVPKPKRVEQPWEKYERELKQ